MVRDFPAKKGEGETPDHAGFAAQEGGAGVLAFDLAQSVVKRVVETDSGGDDGVSCALVHETAVADGLLDRVLR